MPDEEIPHMLAAEGDGDQAHHGEHWHSKTAGGRIADDVSEGDMAEGAWATSAGEKGGGGMELGWMAKGAGASSADPPEPEPLPPPD